LPFFHQHPDSSLPAAAYYNREHAYQDHDQNRRTEYGQKDDSNQWDYLGRHITTACMIALFVVGIDNDAMLATKPFLQFPVNPVGDVR